MGSRLAGTQPVRGLRRVGLIRPEGAGVVVGGGQRVQLGYLAGVLSVGADIIGVSR